MNNYSHSFFTITMIYTNTVGFNFFHCKEEANENSDVVSDELS